MHKASEARSVPLVRRDALCALPLERKVERRLTRPQITGGRPQSSRQYSPKWMEREILSKIPSRMEHEMLTSMEGERVKGSPTLRAHLDQVLHTVVLPGLTRLNSEGARLNR